MKLRQRATGDRGDHRIFWEVDDSDGSMTEPPVLLLRSLVVRRKGESETLSGRLRWRILVMLRVRRLGNLLDRRLPG